MRKTKFPEYRDGGIIHRMIPPLNVEVWDSDNALKDGYSSDDILGSVKIDIFDYDYLKKKKKLDEELKKIEEAINSAVEDENS